MSARSGFFFFQALVFILCVVAFQGAARAETAYLPSPYVPWLEGQGFSRDDERGDETRTERDRKLYRPAIPDAPVLTPQHTRELIRELEGEQAASALPSPLEDAYSDRVVDRLTQFGYDLFAGDKDSKDTGKKDMPAGAVQDDFVLDMGDRLSVIFRGQRKGRDVYVIDNQGLLVIDDLPPIPAAGRTIGQVREALEDQADRLHNTDIFIALESVRQVGILVVGHVGKPGRKTLTVFDTVLDALAESGGIEKTGSLRQIKLVRSGRSTVIDLYGLLIYGSAGTDIQLRDGDKLIVPPVGPTVGIAGGVKRPGIYEILPTMKGMLHAPQGASRAVSLEEMLELAGGALTPGQNRFIKLGLTDDGRETVEDIDKPHDPVFGDGSILSVASSREARTGTVELAGHTRRPGLHDLDKAPSLSALLDDDKVFGPDIYPLIGVIERWDEGQMAAQLLDFPPLLVTKGTFDRKLQDGDVVHLFSRTQILGLQKPLTDDDKAQGSSDAVAEEEEAIADPVMRSFLTERAAFIRGAVRREGAYPVAEGASLENLIAVAGGLALEANSGNIEVTSAAQDEVGPEHGNGGTKRTTVDFERDNPDTVMLEPGDAVRVNQKFHKIADNSVEIAGQVARPGRYDLLPGDHMSDLLRRVGGLTNEAYPDGAIFSRESERKAEESRFRSAARDMERAIAAAAGEKDEAPDTAQIALARDLAAELRQVQAVGRITVEADPGVLAAQTELDILLESGDRIYIPSRPLTVRVNGEILSPASLQFRKDKDAANYIDEAGGFTYNADKDRVFVLYPNGSAQPLLVNAWNHSPSFIPPGSTIVVPRDPKPFSFIESARDITQILSNLAITGIFLDDLRNN